MQLVNKDLFFFQFYEKFGKEPKKLGSSKDWNVDLIPKFIMAGGMKYTYICTYNSHVTPFRA